jgi:hypothetical protein
MFGWLNRFREATSAAWSVSGFDCISFGSCSNRLVPARTGVIAIHFTAVNTDPARLQTSPMELVPFQLLNDVDDQLHTSPTVTTAERL